MPFVILATNDHMEKQLARLIRKHGPLDVLETFTTICQGEAFAETGKKSQYRRVKEAAFERAAYWRRWTRELRRALGALRRDEPDAERVERRRVR